MNDTDLAMRHQRAKESADDKQRTEELRCMATALMRLPAPGNEIRAALRRGVVSRLLADANDLERGTP